MDKPEKKRMNKWGILLWGILHVAIIALGLNASPWKIDSNLFSVLPPSQVSAGLGDADAELSRRTMGQMTVLVGHSDFEKAKAAAAVKAAESKAAEKPAESKTEEKPADSKAAGKLADSKAAEKPSDSKAAEKPAESKTEEKPADSKVTEKPAENKTEGGDNK